VAISNVISEDDFDFFETLLHKPKLTKELCKSIKTKIVEHLTANGIPEKTYKIETDCNEFGYG
jgi:hypothetical protein